MKNIFVIFCLLVTIANVQNFEVSSENKEDDRNEENLANDYLEKRIEIHGNRFHEYYDPHLVEQGDIANEFDTVLRTVRSSEEFSYDPRNKFGPSNWHRISPYCGGSHQSPIDIIRSNVHHIFNKPVPKLRITKWNEIPSSTVIENAGHTFKIRFTYKNGKQPSLSLGPLPENSRYYLQELHFHFGLNSHSGAEHLINGHSYAAESHLVFYHSKYGSYQNAINHPYGLAVIARFYEASNYNHEHYPYIPFLSYIQHFNQSITFHQNTFSLKSVLGSWSFDYYTYRGSLTTPPCTESVTWIIADQPLQISNEQLQQFRYLRQSNGGLMAPNFRPVQPANHRVVKYLNT